MAKIVPQDTLAVSTGRLPESVSAISSSWPRYVCWLVLAVLHLTAGACFALFAVVYTQLSDGAFGSNSFVYGLILARRHLALVGVVGGALGVCHVVLLIRMVLASVARRRLSFHVPRRAKPSAQSPSSHTGRRRTSAADLVPATARTKLSSFQRYVALPLDSLVGRTGWIGIEGPFFDHFFVLRELTQVVLQTFQLAKIARLLSRAWLLDLYVVITVAKCWSMELLQLGFVFGTLCQHKKQSTSKTSDFRLRRRRLYVLLIDSSLDMVSTFLMPLVVVIPYALIYDPAYGQFPPWYWGDDLWIMKVVAEIQLLFVSSWSDACVRLAFALLILLSTLLLHDLCHDEFDDADETVHHHSTILNLHKNGLMTPTQVYLVRFQRWTQSFLVAGGLLIIGIHAYASYRPHVDGCLLPVRPWFHHRASCAVYRFDCHTRSSMGDRTDTLKALEMVSPGTVTYFIFQHCRGLEMPPNVQQFPKLLGIKLYNVTLAAWPTEAALHANLHPSFRLLTMVRVAFPNDGDRLPDGLTRPNFPHTLSDVNVCVSNLRQLPSDLDAKWPRGLSLLLEHSRFETFPDVVARMDPSVLSLQDNRVRSVPVELLRQDSKLRILSLGSNPIEDFGQNVTSVTIPSGFYWLILDDNKLPTLPKWLNDSTVLPRLWLVMDDTPVCEQAVALTAQAPDPHQPFPWQNFVDCRVYDKTERNLFRLVAEDRRSSLDPDQIGVPTLV